MKHLIIYLAFFSSLFFFAGCQSDTNDTTVTNTQRTYNLYDAIKVYTLSNKKSFLHTLEFKDGIEYAQLQSSKDGKLFELDGTIILSKAPLTKSSNKRVYELEVYLVDKNNKDHLILIKIVIDDNENQADNNTTDNNTTDNNTTDNNTTDNNTTDNNSSTPLDSDHDYIPNLVELYLKKNPNSSDENSNNILDGLEGDPLFDKQWYIHSLGITTNPSSIATIENQDLSLLELYHNYMGYNDANPIIIQIVDSGIDIYHEDLEANIDLTRSLNGNKQGNPLPGGIFKAHGTMLAGIAAARAFNNVGIRGVAPFAKIAGSNWLAVQSLDALDAAWFSGPGANEIAVSNNSWGKYFSDETIYEDILSQGATQLRDGKGRVYVFASGNAREDNADANTQFIINNRYALVVGALTYENKVAPYSTAGANVWTVAYGGANDFDKGPTIATTYLSGQSMATWAEDEKRNYTYAMAGSSAAAPMVTGAIALILEACPNLSYRDVKYIIAKTAKKVDSQNSSWITNAAGFHFSRDYGFGLINTKAAIEMCSKNYTLLTTEKSAFNSLDEIDEDITSSKISTITIDKNIKIEWVEATIDLEASNASQIDIYLTSPSGTKVKLLQSGTKIGEYYIPDPNWMSGGFRLSTGAMLDESSLGDWSVEIINKESNNSITLSNIELQVYGH